VRRRHSSISPKTKQGSNGPLPKRHKFRKPKLQREIYILGYGTKRQIKSSRKAFDLFKAVNPRSTPCPPWRLFGGLRRLKNSRTTALLATCST
jgi:hypothetical protein